MTLVQSLRVRKARKLLFHRVKSGQRAQGAEVRGLTRIDSGDILERCHQQHEHNSHAEYLYTASRHVQHESLHR